MFKVRAASDRGVARFDWLDSRHSFSFGHYYDPQQMGFGVLRVINEDKINPGQGFGMHSHQDMEIITYVLEGALEHQDSLGNRSVIRAGDVQRMTAGTGIRHSEFNASTQERVHLLQIWILPDTTGLPPGYEEIHLEFGGSGRKSVPFAPHWVSSGTGGRGNHSPSNHSSRCESLSGSSASSPRSDLPPRDSTIAVASSGSG